MLYLIAFGALAAAGLCYRFVIRPTIRKHQAEELVEGDSEGLPVATDHLGVIERSERRQTYACGHEDADRFALDLYGETLRLKDAYFKDKPHCGDCLMKLLTDGCIRCALCGLLIRPGDPVALYGGGPGLGTRPSTMVDGQYVGCLRWDCCPSGGFFAGHWTSKGFRPAFGGNTAAAQAFATGEMTFMEVGPLEDDSEPPSK